MDIAEQCFHDNRHGKNTRYSLGAQLRQSVFSRLAGYEDTNDTDRLAVDPAMRQVVGGRAEERMATSREPCSGRGTSTVRGTGRRCSNPSSPAIVVSTSPCFSGGTRRSPIRTSTKDSRPREIEHLLTRPVGRPPKAPVVRYHDFMNQASGWNHARRVIAKVKWHRGELFPRAGFIVTNPGFRAKDVVHFYNQRGTAEQWIEEGMNAVKWMRLSCHDFADNQVRLQLYALAYNLGNFLRQMLPKSICHWTMTTLREKLIKIGAKVICHARYIVFQMAEVAVPQKLFAEILRRVEKLRLLVEQSG
jgi:hypothetical protein